ncbi:uncharacterized protein LOC116801247 [Drosophila sechellia]|uniref:uncharacterized protein LOC116801247 n=1 Tax=Drosophila sechellia TaxID=7238 RepID=UPI0013DE7003|nr:uncharacterized protein LOC116801247 [Drosophila sechellia]
MQSRANRSLCISPGDWKADGQKGETRRQTNIPARIDNLQGGHTAVWWSTAKRGIQEHDYVRNMGYDIRTLGLGSGQHVTCSSVAALAIVCICIRRERGGVSFNCSWKQTRSAQ